MEKTPIPRSVQIIKRLWPVAWVILVATSLFVRRAKLSPLDSAGMPKPRWGASSTLPNASVELLMSQVISSTVYSYTGGLSGEWPVIISGQPYTIETRATNSGEPLEKAVTYVGEHMADLGLDVQYHDWDWSPYSGTNVIGEQPGYLYADNIYLITAHLDNRPYSGPAPGADDNASGSTAVLVAADILSQHQWGCTVRFAFFTGEEQGLLGSKAYASQVAAAGEDIRGVINLDMIAWNSPTGDKAAPWMELHAAQNDPRNLALAQLFVDIVESYQLELLPEIVPNPTGASDHASFWTQGYPAILAIEDYRNISADSSNGDFNPYYHTSSDKLEHLDLDYFTDIVRAAVGTLAHQANCQQQYYFPLVSVGGSGKIRPMQR